jgi:eukaryotic-like serine/threonine-protein kinase
LKRCPSCNTVHPDNTLFCPRDGSALIEADLWSPGSVIRGKYRLIGKIGQGGMGAVFKASHVLFDESRALKVMNRELMSDEMLVKRFKQEAVMARKLDHPNAVSVDDIDEAEDGRPFMVMEYIEGQGLKELIHEAGPLPARRAAAIARQVASGLGAAHAIGMVHRDIKPANIVLIQTAQGEQAKVLDFGIAKLKEARADATSGLTLTGTGMVIGTPQYMSPEQALGRRGSELDGRSDLYSLGIVLYQMLSGELPYKADTTMGLLLAHINQAPKPILEVRPDLHIPPALARVVMQCLEKQPDERPRDAATLIGAIDGALEAETTAPTHAPSAVSSSATATLTLEPAAAEPPVVAATHGAPLTPPLQPSATAAERFPASPPGFQATGHAPAQEHTRAPAGVDTPQPVPETSYVGPVTAGTSQTLPASRPWRHGTWVVLLVVFVAIGWTAWHYIHPPSPPVRQPLTEQPATPNPQPTPPSPTSSEPASAPPTEPPTETTTAQPPESASALKPPETAKAEGKAPSPSERPAAEVSGTRQGVESKVAPPSRPSPPGPSSTTAASTPTQVQPAPSTGDLVVTTSPGAQIYLDGSLAGTTDASGNLHVPGVTAGEHKIHAQLGSATSTERPIRVGADLTAFYTLVLPTPAGSQAPATPVTPAQPPAQTTAPQAVASFPVSHRHAVGSCKGTLLISGANVVYRTTESNDSFSFPLSDITFGLQGGNEFFVQEKGGKKYSFRSEGSAQVSDIVRAIKQAVRSQ